MGENAHFKVAISWLEVPYLGAMEHGWKATWSHYI